MAKVVLIAGPTASGKSAYAQRLASLHNGIIINADSLQIYRGLEILTAQPPLTDQRTLPHRLYGFLDPSQISSVGDWLSFAHEEIKAAHQNGYLPIVVGGSGLYLKALMEGLPPLPPLNPIVRKEVQSYDTPTLYKELTGVDPVLAKRLNPQDRQRISRGVEVFRSTGKPLSLWQSSSPAPPPYLFETYLYLPSPDILAKRIDLRLGDMLKNGVIEEVSALLNSPLSPTARKAIGLREFGAYIQGEISLEEAKSLTHLHTRQYAKRQSTWFRHQLKANHIG